MTRLVYIHLISIINSTHTQHENKRHQHIINIYSSPYSANPSCHSTTTQQRKIIKLGHKRLTCNLTGGRLLTTTTTTAKKKSPCVTYDLHYTYPASPGTTQSKQEKTTKMEGKPNKTCSRKKKDCHLDPYPSSAEKTQPSASSSIARER
jgi:hypothetical protein